MELALYHPEAGYYEQPARAIGKRGDYYTSVSVGCLFGELLAVQFAAWCEALSEGPCQIVEAGAHDGQLASDILRWLGRFKPGLVKRLEYWLIEPSAIRHGVQASRLAEFAGTVRWFTSWETVPPGGVRGIIFANELLDSMPVHRFGWDAAQRRWFEWGVTIAQGQLDWARVSDGPESGAGAGAPAAAGERGPVLPELPPDLLAALPDGFVLERCPAAQNWWAQAAAALREGKLLGFDYGSSDEAPLRPERKEGTLRAYDDHRVHRALLDRPGQQDLTADVDFAALRAAGIAAGLQTEAWQTQSQFITRILEQTQAAPGGFPAWTPTRLRQFRTLIHPDHLGRAFHVLVQGRPR